MSEGPVARKVKVKYRFFGTLQRELDETFPLASDERLITEGSVRVRTGIGLRRLGDLRVTDRRLVLVSHYALQPDRGLEIPRGSLTKIIRNGSTRTLYFKTESGEDRLSIEHDLLVDEALRQWASDASQGL